MNVKRLRRTTANIPTDLLDDAMAVTKLGITETLIAGLKMVSRTNALAHAKNLRGKLDIKLDLNKSRERTNR